MKIKENIIAIKVAFNGIYEWGKGYLTVEKAEQYKRALSTWKGIQFKVFTNNDSDYIVSTGGCGYLHPMDFAVVLRGCGVQCGGGYFVYEIDELKKFAAHVASYCNCTYTIKISKQEVVNFEFDN